MNCIMKKDLMEVKIVLTISKTQLKILFQTHNAEKELINFKLEIIKITKRLI